MQVFLTGVAGFIGFHLAKALLDRGDTVVGIDNLNDYYSVELKQDRLRQLHGYKDFQFHQVDLVEADRLNALFVQHSFDVCVNLAAQAGVRYSLTNPGSYVQSNLVGFVNVLEACRHYHIKNLVYASSSSVYGANKSYPFCEEDNVDHPVSLYAATKKSNELMAHTYSSLYGIPTTGLRFFTVYGPWGRPDMALFKFVKNIFDGKPIEVYNEGNMARDFTYVGDILEGILQVVDHKATSNPEWRGEHPLPSSSCAPYRIYNVGHSSPVDLMEFVHTVEREVGQKAIIHYLPMQQGDVPKTYADVSKLTSTFGYQPKTTIEEGVKKFVDWYREYYRVGNEAVTDRL